MGTGMSVYIFVCVGKCVCECVHVCVCGCVGKCVCVHRGWVGNMCVCM